MKRNWMLLETAALLAMGLTMVCAVLGFAEASETVEDAVLRLHVIANSDEEADQLLKLAVRDAMLETGKTLAEAASKQQAQQEIAGQLDAFCFAAKQVVTQRGFDYPVAVSLERSFFPTRTYGDVTLPAGMYDALRVVIGAGEGKNWWCVMFPPLCLPAAAQTVSLEDVLDEDALALVREEPKYELRFWIVEKWREWRERKA